MEIKNFGGSGGGGGGTPGGSNTQLQYNNSGSFGGVTGGTWDGSLLTLPLTTFTPAARTSGVASYLTINMPADTGLTANTESKGINVVGATRTWADGTVATQREYFFGKPTYNKTTTSAVFTNAATLYIDGNPTAGAGVTITNPWTLWAAGNARFGTATTLEHVTLNGGVGTEVVGSNNTIGGVNLTIANTSNGTSAYGGIWLQNDSADGTNTKYGYVGVNSSTYSDPTFGTATNSPNQMYVYNTMGNLVIGSFIASGVVQIVTGGVDAANIHMTIDDNATNVLNTSSVAQRGIFARQISSDTSSSRLNLAKARGTTATPTTVVTGDLLGNLAGWGYDGTNYINMASIQYGTSGTIGTARVPTYMAFFTATDAATSVLTEAMRIDNNQTITVTRQITKRTVTVADATSFTPAMATTDICYQLNTQGAGTLTVNAPTGTIVNGMSLLIKIKSTSVQTFSWNAAFIAGATGALPTATTGGGKIDYYPFIYDSVNSKWNYTLSTSGGF